MEELIKFEILQRMNLVVRPSQKRKLQKNMAHLTQPEMYVKSDGKRRRRRPPRLRPRPPSPPPPPPDWARRPRPAEMVERNVSSVLQLYKLVQQDSTLEMEGN